MVTIEVNYRQDDFENSVVNAALEGLKELVKNTIENFASEINSEGGTVLVRINELDKVEVKADGLSKNLRGKIFSALRELSEKSAS